MKMRNDDRASETEHRPSRRSRSPCAPNFILALPLVLALALAPNDPHRATRRDHHLTTLVSAAIPSCRPRTTTRRLREATGPEFVHLRRPSHAIAWQRPLASPSSSFLVRTRNKKKAVSISSTTSTASLVGFNEHPKPAWRSYTPSSSSCMAADESLIIQFVTPRKQFSGDRWFARRLGRRPIRPRRGRSAIDRDQRHQFKLMSNTPMARFSIEQCLLREQHGCRFAAWSRSSPSAHDSGQMVNAKYDNTAIRLARSRSVRSSLRPLLLDRPALKILAADEKSAEPLQLRKHGHRPPALRPRQRRSRWRLLLLLSDDTSDTRYSTTTKTYSSCSRRKAPSHG